MNNLKLSFPKMNHQKVPGRLWAKIEDSIITKETIPHWTHRFRVELSMAMAFLVIISITTQQNLIYNQKVDATQYIQELLIDSPIEKVIPFEEIELPGNIY